MPTAPRLNQFQYTYEKDSVTIYGSVNISTLGQVSSFQGGGIEDISPIDPVVAATFSGQVAGMTTDISLVADTPGAAGNSISLAGDGTSTVAQLITAWNGSNPSNTVSLVSGDDTQIPNNMVSIDLSGGSDGTPGEYQVLLSDVFNRIFDAEGHMVLASPSTICKVQIFQSAAQIQSAVRGHTVLKLLTQDFAGSAAWPDDSSMIMLRIVCRNSSLNVPTGA